MPGEASGVVNAQEGHLLARAGRSGPAFGIAALAIAFGPAETASLMLLGIAAAVALTPAPLLAAWALAALGALLGLVGTDVAGGRPRLTFGIPEFSDGIGFVPLAMACSASPS